MAKVKRAPSGEFYEAMPIADEVRSAGPDDSPEGLELRARTMAITTLVVLVVLVVLLILIISRELSLVA